MNSQNPYLDNVKATCDSFVNFKKEDIIAEVSGHYVIKGADGKICAVPTSENLRSAVLRYASNIVENTVTNVAEETVAPTFTELSFEA